MKKNWFIGLVLIAIMAFGVGCSDGSDVVQPPDEPVIENPDNPGTSTNSVNLVWGGDFESETHPFSGTFTIENVEGNNVGVFEAGSSAIEFITLQDFSKTSGTFSAKVKLENEEDSSKVFLYVERFTSDSEVKNEVTSGGPTVEATTDWQTISIDVNALDFVPFKSKFKVEVSGTAGRVLVDDIKFIPADATKVNFLPFGDFDALASAPDTYQRINLNTSDPWTNSASLASELSNSCIKIGAQQQLISNYVWYKNNGIAFPNNCKGKLDFTASTDSSATVTVLIKAKDSNASESVFLENNIELSTEAETYSVEFGIKPFEYAEFEVQFTQSGVGGTVYLDSVNLHII